MNNSNLHKAKKAANDEFYTRIEDIENELRHYKDHFKNKIIFCNFLFIYSPISLYFVPLFLLIMLMI